MSTRPSLQDRWYDWVRLMLRLSGVLFYRVRCTGRQLVPQSGGVILLSNHQSFLDPLLIGAATNRRMNPLARDSLFRYPVVGPLIRSLNSIPLDRDGLGLSGLKETLKRLREGNVVLIFPEGTRSADGEVRPLKAGFTTLARRAKVPLVPVAIDGAYEAWPRQRKLPGPSTIEVCFGPPILPEQCAGWSAEEMIAEVERRIRACHRQAKDQRRRRNGGQLDDARSAAGT
jgi:1-acyl-sn-glycerol-3-phosphate acyltransferase